MKKIILLLFAMTVFSGCEKDDICTDETTPHLVLEFYDDSNPSVLKNVTSLQITGINSDGTEMATPLGTYNAVSKILLPLRNTEDVTRFNLVLNSNNASAINLDKLEFNYTREEIYVSRACGFKTVYELNATGGVVLTDATPADLFWIRNMSIQTNTIETENEVHIKIYF